MRVKIVKCSRPTYWYMNQVGLIFEILPQSDSTIDYYLDVNGYSGMCINKKDCEPMEETKVEKKELDPFWKEKLLEAAKEMHWEDPQSTIKHLAHKAEQLANSTIISPLVKMIAHKINCSSGIVLESELQKAFDESGAWEWIEKIANEYMTKANGFMAEMKGES